MYVPILFCFVVTMNGSHFGMIPYLVMWCKLCLDYTTVELIKNVDYLHVQTAVSILNGCLWLSAFCLVFSCKCTIVALITVVVMFVTVVILFSLVECA